MENNVVIRGSYLLTVFLAALLVIIGNKITAGGLSLFQENSREIIKTKIQKINDKIIPDSSAEEFIPMQG